MRPQVGPPVVRLKLITGPDGYVFPALTDSNRPMSENRRMGYSGDEATWHGFRTIASTLLNEQGWHPDLIELQLAHRKRNAVRDAYNRAQRLPERRKMMQAWADYLQSLRAGGARIADISPHRKHVADIGFGV